MISKSRAVSIETPSRMKNGRWKCRYRWFDEYGKRRSASAYGDTRAAARTQAQLVGHLELARVEAIQRGCDPGPLFMPTFAEVAAEAMDNFKPFAIAGGSVLAALLLCLFGLRYTPW